MSPTGHDQGTSWLVALGAAIIGALSHIVPAFLRRRRNPDAAALNGSYYSVLERLRHLERCNARMQDDLTDLRDKFESWQESISRRLDKLVERDSAPGKGE